MTMTTPVVAAATASVGVAPTLPAALVSRACSASGDTIAARERAVGLWCERTWRSVRDEAAELGMGLRALGVRAGDRVGIAARNSLTWVAFDLGVQGIGAVSVTLPPTTATDAVIDLARRHTLRVVLVDDDDQASISPESTIRSPTCWPS